MLRAEVLGLWRGDELLEGAPGSTDEWERKLMAHISRHAAERYVERIAPHLTCEQAEAIMLRYSAAIDRAAAFGCHTVRLGDGTRLCLRRDTVTTVKGPMTLNASHAMVKTWKRNAKAERRRLNGGNA